MRHIQHHFYNLPGLTDRAVIQKNCEDYARKGETCILHDHAHAVQTKSGLVRGGSGKLCTESCILYLPGESPRSVLATHEEIQP